MSMCFLDYIIHKEEFKRNVVCQVSKKLYPNYSCKASSKPTIKIVKETIYLSTRFHQQFIDNWIVIYPYKRGNRYGSKGN